MKNRIKIPVSALVPMDLFVDEFDLRVNPAYAAADNLLFGERLYRADARLWLHEDLARIILLAAQVCKEQHGLRMVLYDGLRTVEAQQAMLETRSARDNPHWLEEPSLLSSPGSGGHPRGMAIDLTLETMNGELLDMGTPFDYLAEDAGPDANPAHRQYYHSDNISDNRAKLENAMTQAAAMLNTSLLPLPQEWWDFRLPPDILERYEPLSDANLPPQMRMTETLVDNDLKDFPNSHFAALKQRLISSVSGAYSNIHEHNAAPEM